jgi:hypothetical protein
VKTKIAIVFRGMGDQLLSAYTQLFDHPSSVGSTSETQFLESRMALPLHCVHLYPHCEVCLLMLSLSLLLLLYIYIYIKGNIRSHSEPLSGK